MLHNNSITIIYTLLFLITPIISLLLVINKNNDRKLKFIKTKLDLLIATNVKEKVQYKLDTHPELIPYGINVIDAYMVNGKSRYCVVKLKSDKLSHSIIINVDTDITKPTINIGKDVFTDFWINRLIIYIYDEEDKI